MSKGEGIDNSELKNAVGRGYSNVNAIINLHGGQNIYSEGSTRSSEDAHDLSEFSGRHSDSRSRGHSEDLDDHDREINRMASKALRAMNEKSAMAAARRVKKSPSFEILENYNQQPLHVRSRAEQWELPRSVSIISQFPYSSHFNRFTSMIRKSHSRRNLARETEASFIMPIGEGWMWLRRCSRPTLTGWLCRARSI